VRERYPDSAKAEEGTLHGVLLPNLLKMLSRFGGISKTFDGVFKNLSGLVN
jgi:hypothetical protein